LPVAWIDEEGRVADFEREAGMALAPSLPDEAKGKKRMEAVVVHMIRPLFDSPDGVLPALFSRPPLAAQ
jgi:hypothetical protein